MRPNITRARTQLRRRAIVVAFLSSSGFLLALGCGDDDSNAVSDAGATSAGSGGTHAGTGGSSGKGAAGAGKGGSVAGTAGKAGAAGGGGSGGRSGDLGPSGPDQPKQQFAAPVGTDLDSGKQVFRFETFGNEGFWTRVMKLPQGMVAAGLTPAQAIAAGLHVDIDAVPADLKTQIAADLKKAGANPDLTKIASFNDPNVLVALVEANAVVGLPVRNVQSLNGKLDINDDDVFAGESVGASCAICHSITDGSVLTVAHGGGIGKRVDGQTNHNLNFGAAVALAQNSRALYPTLALDLVNNMHGSVSRKGAKSSSNPLISAAPSEAEVDAYLNDPVLYPIGMFDDAPDGDGAPMHTTPLFRPDLGAPWGSEGSIHEFQNFSNLVYTALLDPTDLIAGMNNGTDDDAGMTMLTGAQMFESDRGGAAGLELLDNYKNLIENDLGIQPYSQSNKNGYPYVGRADKDPGEVKVGLTGGAKIEPSPIGMQVNQTKLKNMTAYLISMHPPAGDKSNSDAIAAGRLVFRQQCTSCHNDDQSKFVPEDIVPFNNKVELYSAAPKRPDLYPDWNGVTLADRSAAGLAPVRNSDGIFDDKLIIVEASNQGQPRGNALPLLMDLARKPVFLHDNSVTGDTPTAALSNLFDPARGDGAPHPFYIDDDTDRGNVVAFLRSLDDQALPTLK